MKKSDKKQVFWYDFFMAHRTAEYLKSLVNEFRRLPAETEWVEFKCNNQNPQMIGEYISALSNSAALCEKPCAYIIWGVDDTTHSVVTTDFDWQNAKKGNEHLETWLARLCEPKINFRFYDVQTDFGRVVLLEIPAAESQPTMFAGERYIRIGSSKKNLKEFPHKERELWKSLDMTPYELRPATEKISGDDIFALLDVSRYYDRMGLPFPQSRENIFLDFANEKFLRREPGDFWTITNLGALLICKSLRNFDSLARKSVRVIWYKGDSRMETIREQEFTGGYAFSHEEIISYIMTIIPQSEVIDGATRKSVISFPEIAVRELLANMLIHQDFEHRGTNPMVEVFSDRIEFSNPGVPLVDVGRIIDTVPVSRNENLAGFMHKCGICEERGSGFDKVVLATAQNTMLSPRVEVQGSQFTKVVLFARQPFEILPKDEIINTCYMHSCLLYVNFKTLTNAAVRELFGLDADGKVRASRIIRETMDEGLIKLLETDSAPRHRRYIPFWA